MWRSIYFRPEHAKRFVALNRETREVQPHGVVRGEQLADPQAHFLNSGNQIYVALCDGNVIGTCAVIPRSVDAFELGLWTISARGLTNDCS
jgi:hypothetical protein